jgi:membrane protease YdiL (CAAX protease family)
MSTVLAIAGPIAVAAAWLVVRSGRVSLWLINGLLMPVLGVLSLLTGDIETASPSIGCWRAAFLGVGTGLGLYGATVAFMFLAGRWPPLARHTAALYENTRGISLPAAVAISALLVAPGEELLWRGVVLEALEPVSGSALVVGVLAWAAYIAANAFSGSVPILLGAIVGGAAWTALAVATEGVVASIACHAIWTGLMVAFPPVPKKR